MSALLCPHCGEEYEVGDSFCISCGANLQLQNYSVGGTADLEDFNRTLSEKLSTDKVEYYNSLVERLESLKGVEVEVEQQKRRVDLLVRESKRITQELNKAQAYEAKEKRDYDRLKGFSFAKIVAKIKGDYDEKLEKEEQEYLNRVALTHEIKQTLDEVTRNLRQAEADLSHLQEIDKQRQALSNEHQKFINEVMEGVPHPEEDALENDLYEIKQKAEPIRQRYSQLTNAMNHVRRALRHYGEAERKMGSASSYADWDTFVGGGFFVDAAKNSNQSAARRLVYQGNRELQEAARYLPEIRGIRGANVEGPGQLDMFFDNIFTDLRSRDRINRSLHSIQKTRREIQGIEQKLRSMLDQDKANLDQLYEVYERKSKELFEMRKKLVEEYLQRPVKSGKI